MTWSRRDFLKVTAGTGVGLGIGVPGWLGAWTQEGRSDRQVVVLELTGGNDALNMVIPHGDDLYHRHRRSIRVPSSDVLPIDEHFGWHPRMEGLRKLYDAGRVSIVHGVGYENPNRSHFRALDIWHSARPDLARPRTGWIGRTVETRQPVDRAFAVRLGGRDLPLALRTRGQGIPTVESLDDFRWALGPGSQASARGDLQARLLERRDATGDDSPLERVRRATRAAREDAERFRTAVRETSAVDYPPGELAARLRLTAALFGAQVGPRVAYLNQTGYDTHSNQTPTHAQLLGDLSGALHAFFSDLDQRGLSDRVLVMVYSEFGRRVAENASAGTDHGAAAPVLLVSGAIRGGLVGERPSLDDLLQGDLRHAIDFRRVYATLLEPWLGIDPVPILGESYPALPVLG